MIFDADILGYFQNGGDNKEAGNLGYLRLRRQSPGRQADAERLDLVAGDVRVLEAEGRRLVLHPVGDRHREHLFGAVNADLVDPVRDSVWDVKAFQDRLEKSYPGYLNQFQKSIGQSKIYFTPQPLFSEFTTDWAAMLQQM